MSDPVCLTFFFSVGMVEDLIQDEIVEKGTAMVDTFERGERINKKYDFID